MYIYKTLIIKIKKIFIYFLNIYIEKFNDIFLSLLKLRDTFLRAFLHQSNSITFCVMILEKSNYYFWESWKFHITYEKRIRERKKMRIETIQIIGD